MTLYKIVKHVTYHRKHVTYHRKIYSALSYFKEKRYINYHNENTHASGSGKELITPKVSKMFLNKCGNKPFNCFMVLCT